MNERWNLDPIYTGFDAPEYKADFEKLSAALGEFVEFSKTLGQGDALESLKKGIAMEENLESLVMKLAGYANLRQAADTKNPECGS